MIILTVPIIFPVIKSLGFDPIWFGVIIVMTVGTRRSRRKKLLVPLTHLMIAQTLNSSRLSNQRTG
jgi:hypothetical protein